MKFSRFIHFLAVSIFSIGALAQGDVDTLGLEKHQFKGNAKYIGTLTKNFVHCVANFEKVPRKSISQRVLTDKVAMKALQKKEEAVLRSCLASSNNNSVDAYRYSEIKLDDNWKFVASLDHRGYLITQLITYDQESFATQNTPIPQGKGSYTILSEIRGYKISCTVNSYECLNGGGNAQ